jgi:hypothetical protein
VLHRCGAEREQPRRFDSRRVVDELRANALKRADRLAELPPLEGVAARRFVRALRQADGQRGNADASGIEHLQRVDESLSFLPQYL